ncbi:G0/G1 switch protein 2 [Gasterosteus aculeatus]|uniref:G0/G1 switch 2 n=2 Tax=Gasterosteus aculeatus TaxID=69293 RepID=A0AAQ4R552_GASAC|nr:G0/G1 switch protein 2-like [Gasterosteus aculeatus aculeatus]
MDGMQDLIPFAKEMLSQKPSRGLLKVYLVGSAFAVLGTLVGLVEAVCHPFSCGEPMDSEMVLMLARERRTVGVETRGDAADEEETATREKDAVTQSTIIYKTHKLNQRSVANRLHAS